jgi:TM2 domain-containing membrane protein YozV
MKKHVLPAVLSAAVCPGLGQMVKGEVGKGIGILAGLALGLFVTVVAFVLSVPIGIILSACLVGAYLWNIYDAFRPRPTPRGRRARWTGPPDEVIICSWK